jgi:hypothetical protein
MVYFWQVIFISYLFSHKPTEHHQYINMNQAVPTFLISANRELCEALLKKLHALPLHHRFVACEDPVMAAAHSEREEGSTFVIDVALPKLMCLLQQPKFLDKVQIAIFL